MINLDNGLGEMIKVILALGWFAVVVGWPLLVLGVLAAVLAFAVEKVRKKRKRQP